MLSTVDRSVWNTIREQYELGSYKTLRELSERHSVGYSALRQRIYDESWKEKVRERTDSLLQSMQEVKEDLGKEYLSSCFKRAKRYEKIIDRSQEMLSTSNDGTVLLDVDAIVAYSKAELNIHALAKSALRISDKVDVTTNGQDLGSSFISAIQKLRDSKDTPVLTSEQVTAVIEAEIID